MSNLTAVAQLLHLSAYARVWAVQVLISDSDWRGNSNLVFLQNAYLYYRHDSDITFDGPSAVNVSLWQSPPDPLSVLLLSQSQWRQTYFSVLAALASWPGWKTRFQQMHRLAAPAIARDQWFGTVYSYPNSAFNASLYATVHMHGFITAPGIFPWIDARFPEIEKQTQSM